MRALLTLVLVFASAAGLAAAGEPQNTAEGRMKDQTRLQVFLDRANFGPGKIDGKDGEFTRKAHALFREAQGAGSNDPSASAAPVAPASKEPPDTSGLNLASVDPVFISYQVTTEDLGTVGELPEEHAAQAKLKSMPYRTALEALSEKFHADPKFIEELNPQIKEGSLKSGDMITVPNVEPFDLAQVKQIKPGEDLEPETASDATEEAAADAKETGTDKKPSAAGTPPVEVITTSIEINTKNKMLVLREGKEIKAAFPVTPGSTQIPSPLGHWKIERIAKMPNFRWDEKMLEKGERSSHFHLLPPGPNNPVGVMWIALNKKGIGIHGTEDPDTIGRAASHGCIRLANWDVVKLAKLVKPGVPVTIE